MHRARRRWNAVALLGAAVLVGLVAVAGAAVGDQERVVSYWVAADVRPDGSARIHEVVDYDFGSQSRHGIWRTVPGLGDGADVEVESATAPDEWVVEPPRIRIGDPDRTVTGRHRYRISYTLEGVAPGGRLAWDAVGAEWTVEIEDVEVHVVAPWRFADLRCDEGTPWSEGGCTARQGEAGHLRVDSGPLPAGEGVTLSASPEAALAVAPDLPSPPPVPGDDSAGLLLPGMVAGVAALAAMAAVWALVRRAGREEVVAGGAADMAHGGDGVPPPSGTAATPVVRMDVEELGDHATTEFVPPPDLTPPEGGILLAEAVRDDHKLAWLVDRAAHGAVDLDTVDGRTTLRWRGGYGATGDPVLVRMFDGRSEIELGRYDADFAAGWKALGAQLEAWRRSSPLWSAAADRRRRVVLVAGIVLALLGAAAVFGAALLTGLSGRWALALVAAAGAAAGAGVAMALVSWELRVRTARGSALWLRTESFRRFVAASEARHADWAAEHGILREYTAWAVALGEVDRWSKAVGASGVARAADPTAVVLAAAAPGLARAASSAATAPSSSGGGGGGGVGGGAGGGGGGSW